MRAKIESVDFNPEEFDEDGRWIGWCPKCEGPHENGMPPSTATGAAQCLHNAAARIGQDVVALVDGAVESIRERNTDALVRAWRKGSGE